MTTSKSQKILSHCHKLLFLLPVTLAIVLAGCNVDGGAPPPPTQITSTNLGLASLHEAGVCTTSACEGTNCQNSGCHSPDDTQNGAFTVSGTVFQQDLTSVYSDSNAVIEFYSTPGGGDTSRLFTLPVDKYGNFYTTETIVSVGYSMYPALYDADNSRRVFMPRPIVPIRPASCNACHGLSDPTKAGTELEFPDPVTTPNPGPPYLRLNNGVTSSAGVSTAYHYSFSPSDPGLNCMQSSCHDGTGAATAFTIAGSVVDSDSGLPYALSDAAIGLFSEPCSHPPTCSYTTTDANGDDLTVFDRLKVAKLRLEVDGKGNFYSTIPIDWSTDTYPSLANYDINAVNRNYVTLRNVEHMGPTATTRGDCYFCHNNTTTPLISIPGQ